MKYRPELDGLRAIAVIPVILCHAGLLRGGFIGVDVFFVLSGYLITSIVLSDLKKQSFSLLKFYERRARRILPALLTMIMVCIPLAILLMPTSDLRDFSQSIIATILFASNFFFWYKISFSGQLIPRSPLVHTWSIGAEEQFYLLFPWFLRDLWRYIKPYIFSILAVLTISSLYLSVSLSFEHQMTNYYMLPSRIWQLTAGAMLAYLEIKRGRNSDLILKILLPLLGLILIVISAVTFVEGLPHPGLVTLIPVVGTCLIIWFGGQNDLGSLILRIKPLVWIGMISYSVYLWHQPILVFMRFANNYVLSRTDFLFYLPINFSLAYFSWRYIEQPFRNPNIVSRRKFVISVLGSSTVIIIIGLLYAC
jgi:peptidoglycan/LPS O-acetylase OafA/YrhL